MQAWTLLRTVPVMFTVTVVFATITEYPAPSTSYSVGSDRGSCQIGNQYAINIVDIDNSSRVQYHIGIIIDGNLICIGSAKPRLRLNWFAVGFVFVLFCLRHAHF